MSTTKRHINKIVDDKMLDQLDLEAYKEMKYTYQYVKMIKEKKIVIGYKIYLMLLRCKDYLEKYEFRQDLVDSKLAFIEQHTSQAKGSNEPIRLALPQKVWLEAPWGFYKRENKEKLNPDTLEVEIVESYERVIHQVFLILGRGQGKTTLVSAIGLVGMLIDNEYGANVQILARVNKQANLVFDTVKSMISRKGTILEALVESGDLKTTQKNVIYSPNNAEMSVQTGDYETLDGTNAHYNIFDEVHAYNTDIIKVVNDGSSRKRKNWITWYISTNGTLRGSVFDTYYEKMSEVLFGNIQDDSIWPLIYEIDRQEDVADAIDNPNLRKNFQKANPLIDILPSLTTEGILQDMISSAGDESSQNEILAKTFNYPAQSSGLFFSNEDILGNRELFDDSLFRGLSKEENNGEYPKYKNVILGADLSQTTDLAAISIMLKEKDKFYFKTFTFLPRASLKNYSKEIRELLLGFEKKGELILHDYDTNDIDFIFDYVARFLSDHKLRPVLLAPDRYFSDRLEELFLQRYNGKVVRIPQGAPTLSEPMKMYKHLLREKKLIFNSSLVTWTHGNVVSLVNTNGQIKPIKGSKENGKSKHYKIDPFAAQLDALAGYMMEQDYLINEWRFD